MMQPAPPRLERPSYGTLHARLNYELGSASSRTCSNCPNPAAEWSYDHLDEKEMIDELGRAYSTDVSHYQALCVSCHRRRDKDAGCNKGHAWTPENTYYSRNGWRHCRKCRALTQRNNRKKEDL